jgi:hypothetical protein
MTTVNQINGMTQKTKELTKIIAATPPTIPPIMLPFGEL